MRLNEQQEPSAIIQKMILVGVDEFAMQQLVGISLVLAALGAILWVHMRERRYGKPLALGRGARRFRQVKSGGGSGMPAS